jgi:hypothetical protein
MSAQSDAGKGPAVPVLSGDGMFVMTPDQHRVLAICVEWRTTRRRSDWSGIPESVWSLLPVDDQ